MDRKPPATRNVCRLASTVAGLTLALTFAALTMPPPSAGKAAAVGTAAGTMFDAPTGVTAESITPLPPVTQTGGLMGTCYAFYELDGQELPAIAADAGSRWDRFDFRWNVIEGEETRQPFNFVPHDLIVDRDAKYGIQVIGILGSTPKWAAPSCPVMASTTARAAIPVGAPLFPMATNDAYWWRPCPPSGLNLPWNDPANVWGNYVYQTVTHFKARGVRVWEIWNEPDLGQLFWSGSPAQYAQLLKVGYQAVKAADPEATVLFAGLAYWSNPSYYVSVLDALKTLDGAAANSYYFDAMSLHLYSSVYQIRPIAAEIQANMASRVGPHPIWLTETGVPLWDEWPEGTPASLRINRATSTEAAAYVIEAFAESRAIGIEKFLFFRNHDENMSLTSDLNEYFGLIRNDRSLRPAYGAFQVAAKYLYGENQITGPFSNNGVRRITFWGTPKGRIDALWNETGTTLAYSHTALLPSATLVDVQGHSETIFATDGVLPLTLQPATANTAADGSFLIGGPPLLVIHADTTAPQSSLRSLPDRVYTDTLELTWDVVEEDAGLWYSEIERAATPTGPWTQVAGWPATQRVTETQVTLTEGGTWYFRSRARDNAGNWEAWPPTADVSTTAILTRTISLSVTAYIDADNSGVWEAGELPASAATLTWRRLNGDVVSSTLGAAWEVTATVDAGTYVVNGRVPDYIAAPHIFTVVPAEAPQHLEITLAFREIRGRAYLPLVMRAP